MCFLVKTSGVFISCATREKWKCRYYRSVGNAGYYAKRSYAISVRQLDLFINDSVLVNDQF
jgi:hypothetical protein